MNTRILIGLLVLAVGAGVGWFVLTGAPQPTTQEQTPGNQVPVTPGETETIVVPTGEGGQTLEKGGISTGGSSVVTAQASVSYTDTGFAPNTITVRLGTAVTFTNQSSKSMWVASAVHPTHQLLPGFDQLKSAEKGGSYTYTFDNVGSWKYHNHVNPTDTGTVVVTK